MKPTELSAEEKRGLSDLLNRNALYLDELLSNESLFSTGLFSSKPRSEWGHSYFLSFSFIYIYSFLTRHLLNNCRDGTLDRRYYEIKGLSSTEEKDTGC